jgi:nucleotide-binding universal stress UspA family protein
MRKILVPIDGSETSMRALTHALTLGTAAGPPQLHLLTVHPEPVIYGEIQVYVSREKMEEMQIAHSRDLLQPALEAARAAGASCSSETLPGDTATVIARRAEELGCDGIVMGTRGMGGVANLVLGSVASKVVHLSKLPVTLVK